MAKGLGFKGHGAAPTIAIVLPQPQMHPHPHPVAARGFAPGQVPASMQPVQQPMGEPYPDQIGFKHGGAVHAKRKHIPAGKVKGPGTGTSDSVEGQVPTGSYIMPADSTQQIGADTLANLGKPRDVALSNGEYHLPPEQVYAAGVQALDNMRNATHQPLTAGQMPGGFKPGRNFAQDGVVLDDQKNPPAAAPEPVPAPTPAPAQAQGPSNDVGNNDDIVGEGFSYGSQPAAQAQTPSNPGTQPPVNQSNLPPTGAGDAAQTGTDSSGGQTLSPGRQWVRSLLPNSVVESGDKALADVADRSNQGKYLQAAGALLPAGTNALGEFQQSALNSVADSAWKPFKEVAKGAMGVHDSDINKATSPTPTPTAKPALDTGSNNPQQGVTTPSDVATPVVNPAQSGTAVPTQAPAQPAVPLQNNITRVGNSYSGSNIGSNFTINGQLPGGGGGGISAQNMGAMNALADRYAAARSAYIRNSEGNGRGGQGVETPTEGYSAERAQLLKAAMTPYAESNGKLTAAQLGTASGLINGKQQAETSRYQTDRQAQTADAQIQGQYARTAMQEEGQNSRTAATNGIAQQRLNLTRPSLEANNWKAQTEQGLYEKLASVQDPKERSAITEQLAILHGQQPKTGQPIAQPEKIDPLTGKVTSPGVYGWIGPTGARYFQGPTSVKAPSFGDYAAQVRTKNPGKTLSDDQLKAQYTKQYGGQV